MVARCHSVVLRAWSRVALRVDSRYRPVKTASSWGFAGTRALARQGAASTRAAAPCSTPSMRACFGRVCGSHGRPYHALHSLQAGDGIRPCTVQYHRKRTHDETCAEVTRMICGCVEMKRQRDAWGLLPRPRRAYLSV